jgi:site-specific recombinase XerD
MREIQQLYGHSSVMTTEKYLGVEPHLVDSVTDRLGLS